VHLAKCKPCIVCSQLRSELGVTQIKDMVSRFDYLFDEWCVLVTVLPFVSQRLAQKWHWRLKARWAALTICLMRGACCNCHAINAAGLVQKWSPAQRLRVIYYMYGLFHVSGTCWWYMLPDVVQDCYFTEGFNHI